MEKVIEALGTALSIGISIFFIVHGLGGDFIAPEGIWVCEELGITIDFDDSIKGTRSLVRGTLTTDGKVKEIACFTSYMSECEFYPIEDVDEFMDIANRIFGGYIYRKGENKMIFSEGKEDYVFIRQEIAEQIE